MTIVDLHQLALAERARTPRPSERAEATTAARARA